MTHKPPLPTHTLSAARALRATTTDAEIKLWYHLRAKRFARLKFRRQHPIPPYIADFYCKELRLVIELDGSQHDEQSDSARTRALQRQGVFVMRFWDNQVLKQTPAVLEVVLRALESD